MTSRLRILECGRIADGFIFLTIRKPEPGMPATLEIPLDFDHPIGAEALSRQQNEPVPFRCLACEADAPVNWEAGPQVFGYRNVMYAVRVTTQTREEIVLRLKRFALTRERALAKLRTDVADLERRA